MRELTDQLIPGKAANLKITVEDEPGAGGANHRYVISGYDAQYNKLVESPEERYHTLILFQNGPIRESGMNGVQNEDLLAVVIDRMRGFQAGKFACRENAIVLTHLETALMWLQKRTRDRIARNVEGTHQL